MRRIHELALSFVEFIPEELSEGVLYISMENATAAHLCCCGCGLEVVTTLSATDWQLTYDGRTVSLEPSIGNWNFPCRSHYWIANNRVHWAGRWSRRQIEAGRQRDRERKAAFYHDASQPPAPSSPAGPLTFLRRLLGPRRR